MMIHSRVSNKRYERKIAVFKILISCSVAVLIFTYVHFFINMQISSSINEPHYRADAQSLASPSLAVVSNIYDGRLPVLRGSFSAEETSNLNSKSPSPPLHPYSVLYNVDRLAVLLQPSPVATSDQYRRLQTIDDTWAKYFFDPLAITMGKARLFASIPSNFLPDSLESGRKLERIEQIILDPVVKPTKPINPYKNMLYGLFHITVNYDPQWICMANDHSFFLPPNLLKFVSSLNSDEIIYTGNRLQRGPYRNFDLYFASGGGGIVLSHVSLKIFMISLALNQNALFRTILDEYSNQTDDACSRMFKSIKNKSGKRSSIDLDLDEDEDESDVFEIINRDSLVCALRLVYELTQTFREQSPELELSGINQITLKLSKLIGIQIIKSVNQQKVNSVGASNNAKTSLRRYFFNRTYSQSEISNKLIRNCNADSEWELTNPGLVVAYCLQAVYSGIFVDSRESEGRERFNAFGVVRTLEGDVDGWYIKAKREFRYKVDGKGVRVRVQDDALKLADDEKLPIVPLSVARYMISMHYVSQRECELLYLIFSRQLRPSIQELRALWPNNGQIAGPYSRFKFKSDRELERLYSFLMTNISVATFFD